MYVSLKKDGHTKNSFRRMYISQHKEAHTSQKPKLDVHFTI